MPDGSDHEFFKSTPLGSSAPAEKSKGDNTQSIDDIKAALDRGEIKRGRQLETFALANGTELQYDRTSGDLSYVTPNAITIKAVIRENNIVSFEPFDNKGNALNDSSIAKIQYDYLAAALKNGLLDRKADNRLAA